MYPFSQHFLLCLGFFLYVPAAGFAVLHLLRRGEVAGRLSRILALGAALSHGALLAVRAAESGSAPVVTALESLLLFLVAVTLLVLALSRLFQMPDLCTFSIPVIAVMTGGSFLLVGPAPGPVGSHPLLIASHIALIALSYATFTIGFITGTMYLIQERQLKSRRPGRLLWLLPSLEVVEQVSSRTITAGYIMLTVGIVLGAVGLALAAKATPPPPPWSSDPKVVWTLLTWAAYTGVVLIRISPRFRGRRVAMVGVLGFVLAIFTYFGTHLFGPGIHRF